MSFTPPGNIDGQVLQQIKGDWHFSENGPVSWVNSNVPLYTVNVCVILAFNLISKKKNPSMLKRYY